MEFNGSQSIAVSREIVWQALNDPVVLQACVPGCESFTEKAPNEYHVLVVAAIGPVKAKFKGNLALSEHVPNEGYLIVGQGDGGVAGFGKMTASVKLEDKDGETLLSYAAKAEIGGKLAQIGSRLVSSVANKMADEFFKRFKAKVSEGAQQA